ncbi:unnamed protein product [Owenia fusiformis]|uniref:DUF4440 domain-containing protein n=1 Tax=Owenia fusiformis TaxID=6347 RepID=A0A8J1YB39_OWEFU|nr:unnamed protein product [Owenia fusiformis]
MSQPEPDEICAQIRSHSFGSFGASVRNFVCYLSKRKFSTMDGQDFKDVVVAKNEKLMAAYKAKNFPACAELYSEDCQIFPPGAPATPGRQGVIDVYSKTYACGAETLVNSTDEVMCCGELGVELASYKLLKPSGNIMEHGKAIVVWKKTKGEWLLHWDIFNANK